MFSGRGCPAEPVTRKIEDIKMTNGKRRFIPLPSEDYEPSNNGSARFIDRDMHPKVLKAQKAYKRPWGRKSAVARTSK